MKNLERDSIDFGRMHIPSLFCKLFFPTLTGMVFNALLNLADGMFVGRGVGSDGLAAGCVRGSTDVGDHRSGFLVEKEVGITRNSVFSFIQKHAKQETRFLASFFIRRYKKTPFHPCFHAST